MSECLFCKIIKGEIASYKVYEDENNLAFLDINPHAKGHVVVIPKDHAETIFELSDEKMEKLSIAIKRTIEKINLVLQPEGYNVGWNHGKIGGQTVPHLHVHIFPRYSGDQGGSVHSIVNNNGGISVEQLAKKFEKI
jgi:histidine triad (HIT) family protein